MYGCAPDSSCLLHCFCTVRENMDPCVWPCDCPSYASSAPTPWLECVHASGHLCMCSWLPMSAWPICIVTWKHGYPCACPYYCLSDPILWLECEHVTVHMYISSQLPHVCSIPMNSYMENVWHNVSESPLFWSHTLVRMCTCISTYMHVYLTPMSVALPLHSYIGTWVLMCDTVCVPVIPLLAPHHG